MNLGSGDEISIKRIAQAVAKEAGVDIRWDTTKHTGDPRRVFDMSRAASYGFFPQISIEEMFSVEFSSKILDAVFCPPLYT